MKEDVGMSKTQKACKQGWEAPKINKPLPHNPT